MSILFGLYRGAYRSNVRGSHPARRVVHRGWIARRRHRPVPVPRPASSLNRGLHLTVASLVLIIGVTVLVVAAVRFPALPGAGHQHAGAVTTTGGATSTATPAQHHDGPDHRGLPSPGPEPGTTQAGPIPPAPDAAPDQAHHHHHGLSEPAPTTAVESRSLIDLTGPQDLQPDVRYELTARTAAIRTDSGREISALTYDGSAPGPTIRAQAGQLVEVVLANADVSLGVTIHWHGLNVPNAEDGVAGVTQDAVMPGERHVYRFRPTQVGTFWYHSHQASATAVARGLFGAVIIDPTAPQAGADGASALDLPLLAHTWTDAEAPVPQEMTIGLCSAVSGFPASPGSRVRLRLINTDGLPQAWTVAGAAYRVVAIDGTAVHGPWDLTDTVLRLAGGGRYDIEFTMPDAQVSVRLLDLNQPELRLSPDDSAGPTSCSAGRESGGEPDGESGGVQEAALADRPVFDPLSYGTLLSELPDVVTDHVDRTVEQVLDTRHGRRQGVPYVYWTINGQVHPDIPPISVAEGDLVRVRISNDGTDVHPMHLHGHHALVLSRNGVPASGSPWWTDTLGVEPGDDFVIAFRADNPGVWMDHCHNLEHAAAGMIMHLEYEGVSSPFSADHGAIPE